MVRSEGIGHFGRTTTKNTPASPPLKGLKGGKKIKNKVLELLCKTPHLNPTQLRWNNLKFPPYDLKDSLPVIANA